MFQGCLMKVSWERKFHGCFKSFSKKFQENVQGVSKKVSCCMALIAASRAEGGLVLICLWLFILHQKNKQAELSQA